jgi:hypothetical protein
MDANDEPELTQAERLVRHDALRAEIDKQESLLAALRAEQVRLLAGCEHVYADGRNAATGGRVKICAICGQVLRSRDEKLWG